MRAFNHRGTRGHGRKYNKSGNKFALLPTKNRTKFSKSLSEARLNNEYGCFVSEQLPHQLATAQMFLTPDGETGCAVTDDGDIVGVFNSGGKHGAVKELIGTAVNAGGIKLDCYGQVLANMYADNGFVPVARCDFAEEYVDHNDFNRKLLEERPDVYIMMYEDNIKRIFSESVLDALPTKDYDEALSYRDKLIQAKK